MSWELIGIVAFVVIAWMLFELIAGKIVISALTKLDDWVRQTFDRPERVKSITVFIALGLIWVAVIAGLIIELT
jgi:hypothetical protein